jgi:dienelactone hydrolase
MSLLKHVLAALMLLSLAAGVQATVQTEEVSYTLDGTEFTGFIAWDDDIRGKRPGILVVHEWWGHNEFARNQAEKLAKAGYTAMAVDMYGGGKLAEHPDNAKAFMQEATSSFDKTRTRFNTARDILESHRTVNKKQIAAQGYCFGGAVVLNMARSGADLAGVVSFHGSLGAAVTPEPGDIQARVQVYTGGADVMVPAEQVAGFVKEMQNAEADLTLVSFPGVRHSFMNPGADKFAKTFDMPVGHDKAAAERAWQGAMAFYKDIFGK